MYATATSAAHAGRGVWFTWTAPPLHSPIQVMASGRPVYIGPYICHLNCLVSKRQTCILAVLRISAPECSSILGLH